MGGSSGAIHLTHREVSDKPARQHQRRASYGRPNVRHNDPTHNTTVGREGLWEPCIPVSGNQRRITVPHLLATRFFLFLGSTPHRHEDAMTKRTYRLTSGLDRALTRHARAQRVAPSVVVRDALSAYLMIATANNDAAHQLAALCEQQRHLVALITRAAGPDAPSRESAAVLDPHRSVNRVLDQIQQRQRKDP